MTNYNTLMKNIAGRRSSGKAVLILLVLMLSLLCFTGISWGAAGGHDEGYSSGQPPVPDTGGGSATFSVTVPTSLPITVAANGTATASDNLSIVNNSDDPIKISSVSVSPKNSWSLVDYSTADFSTEKVNQKKIGMQIQGSNVSTSGTVSTSGFTNIPSGDNETISYSVKLGTQTTSLNNEEVADVSFTVSMLTVSSLSITTPPTKTVYKEGESFDTAGMVITATYEDGTTATVTGYVYSTGELSKIDTEVTITYGGKSVTQDITVESTSTPALTPTANIYTGETLSETKNLEEGTVLDFPYIGDYYKVTLPEGKYKLEAWGAQGGSYSSYYGGLGGYSVGTITLDEETNIYVYSGGQPTTISTTRTTVAGGFNGGGAGYNRYYSNVYTYGQGGGGGSDFRVGTDSLYARVLVAGGGGGSASVDAKNTKYGGGVSGGSPQSGYSGTQTSAGTNGQFGIGGAATTNGNNYKYGSGGGGGGWYGGGACSQYSDSTNYQGYNGGGSGYVYTTSTKSNYPTGCLLTDSFLLTDAATYGGNNSFTDYSGSSVTGHSGDGACRITVIETATIIPYLTFSSSSDFTLATYNLTKNWNGKLEYSVDQESWTEWDGTISLSSEQKGALNILYLRGRNNTIITGNNSSSRWVLTGSDISCNGNIENLLDYVTVESGDHPSMGDYAYSYLFFNNQNLLSAPSLQATTLSAYCYKQMFQACVKLVSAPKLPATTLSNYCYDGMFSNCNSLISTPELPATNLAIGCYRGMFGDCYNLATTVSTLPAAILEDFCYMNMFQDCYKLISTPELPSTNLAQYCYRGMFVNCTSLTSAPSLPAIILSDYCYYMMFSGCTALKSTPILPATTLANNCYQIMFERCTGLTSLPELPATTLANRCYLNMFKDCANIQISETQTGIYQQPYRIPAAGAGVVGTNSLMDMFSGTGGTFAGTPMVNKTYYVAYPLYLTFSSPSSFTLSIKNIDYLYSEENPWDGTVYYSTDTNNWSEWNGRGTIASVSKGSSNVLYVRGINNSIIVNGGEREEEDWVDDGEGGGYPTTTHITYYYSWSINGSNVKCDGNIETLMDYTMVENGEHPTLYSYGECFEYMFSGCTALISAPALCSPTLSGGSEYLSMFENCTNLVSAPIISATSLGYYSCQNMFAGCTSLETAPVISATTMGRNSCVNMFKGCTSLVNVPDLSVTTLDQYSCDSMFYGCTSLVTAPEIPATTVVAYSCQYMFYGCTSLTTAPLTLPAESVWTNSYYQMFSGCTALVTAPNLPATALGSYSYGYMFYNCKSLTSVPSILPATKTQGSSGDGLPNSCYYSMFEGCTSLVTPPALPASSLIGNCYYRMFYGCSSLTSIPALPITWMGGNNACGYMFYGCSNIKLSSTLTGTYTKSYPIPYNVTGDAANTNQFAYMFTNTGGTFKSTPTINTAYYLDSSNSIVGVDGSLMAAFNFTYSLQSTSLPDNLSYKLGEEVDLTGLELVLNKLGEEIETVELGEELPVTLAARRGEMEMATDEDSSIIVTEYEVMTPVVEHGMKEIVVRVIYEGQEYYYYIPITVTDDYENEEVIDEFSEESSDNTDAESEEIELIDDMELIEVEEELVLDDTYYPIESEDSPAEEEMIQEEEVDASEPEEPVEIDEPIDIEEPLPPSDDGGEGNQISITVPASNDEKEVEIVKISETVPVEKEEAPKEETKAPLLSLDIGLIKFNLTI